MFEVISRGKICRQDTRIGDQILFKSSIQKSFSIGTIRRGFDGSVIVSDTRPMPGLVTRPRSRIFHGHDWVYSSEVQKTLRVLDRHTQRRDRPEIATQPETHYLKGFTFQAVGGF